MQAAVDATLRRILSKEPEPLEPDNDELQAIFKLSIAARQNFAKSMASALQQPNVDPNLTAKVIGAHVDAIRLTWRLFPINKFPVEILAKIFGMVAWSVPDAQGGVIARMRLTWVCKQWREVAVNNRSLWSSIWFNDRFPYTRSLLFLDRAGSAPLDIRLNEHIRYFVSRGDPAEELSAERTRFVMGKILAKADQIRRLFILVENWPGMLVAQEMLQNAPRPMSQLQHLELHRTGRFDSTAMDIDPNPFSNPTVLSGRIIPALTHLTLNGTHIDWQNSSLSNLTTLDLRRNSVRGMPPIHVFLDVLRASPRLHKLCLDGAAPAPPNETPAENMSPVVFANLAMLCIGDFSLQYCIYLVSWIIAPNVLDLTLQNLNAEDFGLFLKSITGKFPRVHVLTLTAFEVDEIRPNERILSRWYHSMPDVTYLRLRQITPMILNVLNADFRFHKNDDIPITMSFQEYEAIQNGPGEWIPLLPKLISLEFGFVRVEDVIHYATTRIKINKPLTALLVERKYCDTLDELVKEKLKKVARVYTTRMVPPSSHADLGVRGLLLAPPNIRAGSRLGPVTHV